LLVPGISEVNAKRLAVPFKTWVSSGLYAVNEIDRQNQITLIISDTNALVHSLAYDSAKFATAAFETATAIRGVDRLPKSLGWSAIKAYYAAFFSAHSLMRMFGHTASFLARGHLQDIHNFANVAGVPNHGRVQAGLYIGKYDPASGVMIFRPRKNSHKDTWDEFGTMLGNLSTDVLISTAISSQKNALAGEIEDLRLRLNDDNRLTKCNWLCEIRNSINYELSHQVWFPYGQVAITEKDVSRLIAQWNSSSGVHAMSGQVVDESIGFFVLCTRVINFCYELSSLVAELGRDQTGICHIQTDRFLRQIEAA
jgi:hypothetical protein